MLPVPVPLNGLILTSLMPSYVYSQPAALAQLLPATVLLLVGVPVVCAQTHNYIYTFSRIQLKRLRLKKQADFGIVTFYPATYSLYDLASQQFSKLFEI